VAGLGFKVIGFVGMASYAVAYACAKWRYVSYHRFKVVAVPVERLPKMPRGYAWRVLSAGELSANAIGANPESQRGFLADGLECLGVFDRAGELAGVIWLGRHYSRDPLLGVGFQLPSNAAWDTGLWVPEDKRMSRAFSAVWAAAAEWLRREGCEWTMSVIADYNIPSILSHRRLGARELRTIVTVRFGRLQLTWGARPFVRVIAPSRLPTARLRAPATGEISAAAS
jgi:hypothetical protein